MFNTKVIKIYSHNHARATDITTPHGVVQTPTFMPVGTYAAVNCLTPADLRATQSQIILGGNTYHMLCDPGMSVIRDLGGMHRYMAWDGPMLTDSGGFQVFSLSKKDKLCHVDEQGAHFQHPQHRTPVQLTPITSIAMQQVIGADIIMAFDQCTPDTVDEQIITQAMQRTHRWLAEAKAYHERHPYSEYGSRQALFGIIQGGYRRQLREQSAEYVVGMDLDGIALGGESIGFDMCKTIDIINWVRSYLPINKTRYAMGVGLSPQDLCRVVAAGIDIFDCVAPTRNARHGSLYCGEIVIQDNWVNFVSSHPRERIQIKNQSYADDDRPIMTQCQCYTCQHHSRAYLHYLHKERSVVYATLASMHNVHVMQTVCQAMRTLILAEGDCCKLQMRE